LFLDVNNGCLFDLVVRDRHGIARKRDKFLAMFMIAIAAVSNGVAVYSDACSL
jgi:sodium-coupled neutral amino acid transporter 2